MLRLPGLIDPHVHLREPGATHKEDFDSGTTAALAGGFTIVLAMPNTQPPLVDSHTVAQAHDAAKTKVRCDYGIYLGANTDNASTAVALAPMVCGLKMYLDQTYGPLLLDGMEAIQTHFVQWPVERPLVAHATGRSLAAVLLLAALNGRPVHVCHVSRKEEIILIRKAKEKGIPVTCEVTPHHLFLTQDDLPLIGAGRGEVNPPLASIEDQEALWTNLALIDCFATDHAPHTLAEKGSQPPPPGLPGLETALGLFLTAVYEGRLTIDDLITRMYTNPQRIFGLPRQEETIVEIDPDAVWEVQADGFHTRCGWSPFEGMQLRGRVRRVTLRGRLAYEDGEIQVPPGYGVNLAHIARQNRS